MKKKKTSTPKKAHSGKTVKAKVTSSKKAAPKKVAKKSKPVIKKSKPVAKKSAPPKKKKIEKRPIKSKQKLEPKKVMKKPEPKKAKPIAKKTPVVVAKKEAKPVKAAPKAEIKQVKPVAKIEPKKENPVIVSKVSDSDEKKRYSEKELAEFRILIVDKLDQAKKDYELLKNTLCHTDDHGTDDTSPTFKALEDGSDVLTREETAQLALRQEKFIQNLQNALIRIENKTYGICRVTGKLIPKERLRRVPHATLSIDAKLVQQFNQ
jgi:RNA polymerase-binding transcription factor DksA